MEVWVDDTPKSAEVGTPKRTSLPVVFPVGWWMRPAACTAGLAWCSAATAKPTQAPEDDGHRGQHGHALSDGPDHLAEDVGQGDRDGQEQDDGEEIGQAGRVLEGMGRVDVEEPPAVGTELLDGLHEADRPESDGLRDAVEGVVYVDRTAQRVHRPLADEDQAGDEGDRG